MFSEQFLENDSFEIEYKGKKINAFYLFDKKGKYKFHFAFISASSRYEQAIIVHLDTFEGKLFIDGEEIKKPKGKFPQLLFDKKNTPSQFELEVELKSGNLVVCNGSDPLGTGQIWHSISQGSAMIIDTIKENHFKFNCNDHENDDDFDDLVFELQITKL